MYEIDKPKVLRMKQLPDVLGVSKSAIYTWIKDLTEAVIPAHKTGIYGVSGEKREIGTDSLTSYAQSMVPGQERIINFINKYRKNK